MNRDRLGWPSGCDQDREAAIGSGKAEVASETRLGAWEVAGELR